MDKRRLINQAILASDSGSYKDMLTLMNQIARQYPGQLNRLERDLLHEAYKHKLTSTNSSLTNVKAYLNKHFYDISNREFCLTRRYITKLKSEIDDTCHDIINLVNDVLLPNATDDEQRTFYLMMIGDSHVVLLEMIHRSDRRKVLMRKAQAAYEQAHLLSQLTQSPLNPVRLATTLSYIFYLYDVVLDREWACIFGQQMMEDAEAAMQRGDIMDPCCATYLNIIHSSVVKWTIIKDMYYYPGGGDFQ